MLSHKESSCGSAAVRHTLHDMERITANIPSKDLVEQARELAFRQKQSLREWAGDAVVQKIKRSNKQKGAK